MQSQTAVLYKKKIYDGKIFWSEKKRENLKCFLLID